MRARAMWSRCSREKNSLVRPPLANLDQLVLVVSIADPGPNAFGWTS